MTQMFEITYRRTGSGENANHGVCTICTCDKLKNGEKINDICGIVKAFEELAVDWGSYENRNAIIKIDLIREW